MKIKGFISTTLAFVLASCASDDSARFAKFSNDYKADTVMRMDLDIAALRSSLSDSAAFVDALRGIHDRYNVCDTSINLFNVYSSEILNIGLLYSGDDTTKQINPRMVHTIQRFVSDKNYSKLISDIANEYPAGSLKEIFDDIDDGFSILDGNLDMHLPNRYVSLMSGFYSNILCTESELCVSLEYYMGKDYEMYKYVDGIYDYQLKNYTKEKISSDAIFGWLCTEFPSSNSTPTLLDRIIYEGKLLYLTHIALPKVSENLILGFSKEEYDWAEANEAQMLQTAAQEKHLFSTDRLTISKYVDPAPFTSFFPSDSPGRCGRYMGYKIVKSYMANNKDVSLQKLLDEQDSQKIFGDSRYNP